jgi:magnesium transporter
LNSQETLSHGGEPPYAPGVSLTQVREMLHEHDDAGIIELFSQLHPKDIADVVAELNDDDRIRVVSLLDPELASEALAEMSSEEHPEEILASLEPGRIGEVVQELALDDAVDLIGEMDEYDQARVLATLPGKDAVELRELMRYDEESAGGIMTTELVATWVGLNAAEAIESVRRQARELGGELYTIFVVDDRHRLVGTVSLQDLIVAEAHTPVRDIVTEPVATVTPDEDQEEVGRIIGRYNLPAVAVVSPAGQLVGQVTWDDVIDVLEAEQTEDILRFGGVNVEEELRGGWPEAVRSRLPWMFVNLATAFLAGYVVFRFQATISRTVILAAIMPIIAGMGGNAGTQALAVTVRRLALTDENLARRWSVVGKEMMVGLVNGAALGLVTALITGFFYSPALGAVVLLAMWGNLIIASIAGAFVPILLERLGADPAVASSIFVTAFTDVAGFFLLLGLAAVLLL